jgi:UDP-GlcNAc:undecaprenyl-phosphate GlcNAc-1-phosphate transferase
MKTFLLIYLGSALLALITTPFVIRFSQRLRIFSIPGNRHMHDKPISHIGGIAIFLASMCIFIPVLVFSEITQDTSGNVLNKVAVLLCAAAFIFFVGLIDDLKAGGLGAGVKFIAQITAAVVVCEAGIITKSFAITNWLNIDFGWFSWPLTVLWIVGITNAINFSDGLDGLAAGISAIACGIIAIFAYYSGNILMAIFMLAMLGSLTGFLFFNFNPAKIFMGDCGSMFLGFTIASSSVLCLTQAPTFIGLALPILALGIPIFDTLFSILRRFLERRSIFAPDRRHFHHRLIDLGFKHHQAVIIIYAITLVTVGLGLFIMFTRPLISVLIFFCLLLMTVYVFHVVGAIRLRETIIRLRQKYDMKHEIQQEIRNFEDVQLYFRQAQTFGQWWQAVSKTADVLGFSNLSIPLVHRDGSTATLNWQQNGQNMDSEDILKVNLSVRDRRAGPKLNLKIEICRETYLESAGRRITLFMRLMDEHNVNTLQA